MQRSRVHIRRLDRKKVLDVERNESRVASASTLHGGIFGALRRSVKHGLECSKLLLQVSIKYAYADGRCGNMASILEVSPGGGKFFNVFEAAPENERDGPAQQSQPAQVSSICIQS